MTGWDTAKLDEIEDLPGPGTLRWTPVRRHFDVRAFGVNAYTATEVGQEVVEEHTEQSNGHEELYVVVAGHARASRSTARRSTRPRGRSCSCATQLFEERRSRSRRRRPCSRWEASRASPTRSRRGNPGLQQRRKAERATTRVRSRRSTQASSTIPSTRCSSISAPAGRRSPVDSEAALADLNRAVELGGDTFREYASDDEDLDSIRADPRFPAAG